MTTRRTHPDSQMVAIEIWTLDVLEGDLVTALLLSQLLWWHQPSTDGRQRVQYARDGKVWLVRADDDWWRDCRLRTKQVRRARSVLLDRGLVEHRRFKKDGAPTSAWRPIPEAIQAARDSICPNPELPFEGQFHGSDPGGAVPTDLPGSVPIPCKTTKDPLLREPLTPVGAVFDAWREAAGKTDRTMLDPKRRRLITTALGSYPLEDVIDAVRGWRHSPHHAGQNDTGTVYNDLGLLLRDAGHIETFRDLERRGPGVPHPNGSGAPMAKVDQRTAAALAWARREDAR